LLIPGVSSFVEPKIHFLYGRWVLKRANDIPPRMILSIRFADKQHNLARAARAKLLRDVDCFAIEVDRISNQAVANDMI